MMFFPVIPTVIDRRVANDADFSVTGSSVASAMRRARSAARETCSSSSREFETLLKILKNSWMSASIFSRRRSRPCSAS